MLRSMLNGPGNKRPTVDHHWQWVSMASLSTRRPPWMTRPDMRLRSLAASQAWSRPSGQPRDTDSSRPPLLVAIRFPLSTAQILVRLRHYQRYVTGNPDFLQIIVLLPLPYAFYKPPPLPSHPTHPFPSGTTSCPVSPAPCSPHCREHCLKDKAPAYERSCLSEAFLVVAESLLRARETLALSTGGLERRAKSSF